MVVFWPNHRIVKCVQNVNDKIRRIRLLGISIDQEVKDTSIFDQKDTLSLKTE